MDSIFKLLHQACGDQAKALMGHMSHPARQILTEAVRTLLNTYAQAGGKSTLNLFVSQWEPWNYEAAALTHDVYGLMKALGRLPRNIKQPDLLISYVSLSALDKLEEMFPNQVVRNKGGPIELPESFKLIYKYLTTEFLLDDFSATDLRKVVELSRDCDYKTIARVAETVQDLHKHTVSFLVATVRHENSVSRAIGHATDVRGDRSATELQKIKVIFDSAKDLPPSRVTYDPDWHRQLDVEIELDEEMRLVAERYDHTK